MSDSGLNSFGPTQTFDLNVVCQPIDNGCDMEQLHSLTTLRILLSLDLFERHEAVPVICQRSCFSLEGFTDLG